MSVDFTTVKGEVVGYSVVLLLSTPFTAETVRVYDAAHGFNEMHRYTPSQGASRMESSSTTVPLPRECKSPSMPAKHGHREMIEGWKRR